MASANRVVLVINSGSSSLKYQLIDADSGVARATGNVERIGEESSPVRDHDAALRQAFDALSEEGIDLGACGLVAVGHRVVHGGNTFYRPTPVDDAVLAKLDELSELAPLHNPPAVKGLEVARKLLPDVPHIAVFDTAFFHDMPPAAATYAIDRGLARALADPPLRVSRHVAPVCERAGRRLPGPDAARPETDCAAPG